MPNAFQRQWDNRHGQTPESQEVRQEGPPQAGQPQEAHEQAGQESKLAARKAAAKPARKTKAKTTAKAARKPAHVPQNMRRRDPDMAVNALIMMVLIMIALGTSYLSMQSQPADAGMAPPVAFAMEKK